MKTWYNFFLHVARLFEPFQLFVTFFNLFSSFSDFSKIKLTLLTSCNLVVKWIVMTWQEQCFREPWAMEAECRIRCGTQWTSTACSRQHKLRYYSQLRNKENRAPRAPTARQARNMPQREGRSAKGAGLNTTKQRHKIGIRQCMIETL